MEGGAGVVTDTNNSSGTAQATSWPGSGVSKLLLRRWYEQRMSVRWRQVHCAASQVINQLTSGS